MKIHVILASTPSGGIGLRNKLPWPRLATDMEHFKSVIAGHALLAGRKTYESLPKFLRARCNVLSSKPIKDVTTYTSWDSALETLSNQDVVVIIGGAQLYARALHDYRCERVYWTNVMTEFQADTHVQPIDYKAYAVDSVSRVYTENDVSYQIVIYTRRHGEEAYLDLVRDVLVVGEPKMDRTNVGTLSVFGRQCRYDLHNGVIPLLTTKKVYWKGAVEELLWFIRGDTSAKRLDAKRVKIWNANASREALDKLGFITRSEGDCGPIYGFQWRHFGAEYKDSEANYAGQGVDQLKRVIDMIRTNPNDRRLIVSAWNPVDLDQMALPPCHVLYQFYVVKGELSCQMYQRSCDLGLGVPFNIASASLLTHMVAHVTGLKTGELVHTMGDVHVYTNHVEALREQCARKPSAPFPRVEFARVCESIDDITSDDIVLRGYESQSAIKMEMAV
jgi:dihydrofolate reductase/thymidylate synthase